MSEHGETQREVFKTLLDIYCTEADYSRTPEYDEWLRRFDKAAVTALFDGAVEAASERWLKEKAAEAGQWVRPSDALPENGQEVLALLDWRDEALPQPLQSGILYAIATFGVYVSDEGDEQRWYTDDHGALLTDDVAYWRPLPTPPALPAPPMEVLK